MLSFTNAQAERKKRQEKSPASLRRCLCIRIFGATLHQQQEGGALLCREHVPTGEQCLLFCRERRSLFAGHGEEFGHGDAKRTADVFQGGDGGRVVALPKVVDRGRGKVGFLGKAIP